MADPASKAIRQERTQLRQLLGYWKTVSGALTAILLVLPIGGAFVEPLLPGVLSVVAPVLGLAVCILGVLFLYYSNRDRTRSQIERSAKILFVVACVLLVVFFVFWFTWVIEVDGDWHISGLTLTDEAAQTISQNKIPDEPRSLLDRFGHDSEDRIWRYRNVVAFVLAFSFAGFFALGAGSFFLFTLRLTKQVPNNGALKVPDTSREVSD